MTTTTQAATNAAAKLTDEQIDQVWQGLHAGSSKWMVEFGYQQFARAIESAVLASLAPAGLETLTRYDHLGAMMVPDQAGDYLLKPDVERWAASHASLSTMADSLSTNLASHAGAAAEAYESLTRNTEEQIGSLPPQQEGEVMNHQNDIPAALGTPFEGGFFAGRIIIAGVLHALVVAPKADGEHRNVSWLDSNDDVPAAGSYDDGMTNTAAMAEAGSELAQWVRSLTIGGHTDWYIPSLNELEILYRNLKPTTDENSLYNRSGVNPSAAPPTHSYNADTPAQTTAADFIQGGTQAFEDEWYWSSTQHAAYDDYAWGQGFGNGYQDGITNSSSLRARAVRRLIIQ